MSTSPKNIQAEHFVAYGELIVRLLPSSQAAGIFGANAEVLWQSSPMLHAGLGQSLTTALQGKRPLQLDGPRHSTIFILPLIHAEKAVGAIAVTVAAGQHAHSISHASSISNITALLKPVIAVVTHELHARPRSRRSQELTERTQELEWLFTVTSELRADSNDTAAVEQLLTAAMERMGAVFGGIAIPEKRLNLTHSARGQTDFARLAYEKAHPHLMQYVQRQNKPLLLNSSGSGQAELRACKLLAIPLASQAGKVIGLMAFIKSASAVDFGRREQYLGRHVARQIGTLLDSQYDLATGLYNRVAFEQHVNQFLDGAPGTPHSLVYVDINELNAVNETFGYDTGDEAIVRVAGVLSTPLLPSNAIVARVAGDRFVFFLPGYDLHAAQACAQAVQQEASRVVFGEGNRRITLSSSCGVALFASTDQATSRTIAAAELACKTAGERGRNRCEVYQDIDQSMMRRRSDVSGLAKLKDALDNNRLCMYAQKIAPINDLLGTSGVECLVRMLDEDGAVVSPSVFMSVAQRYQLLQEVDAWVIQNTLKILSPYASSMLHSGLYASINISGQSLCDAGFLARVAEWVRGSRVPPGAITFEITETAAVSNLAQADELMRGLRQMGCRFALDDFGTGVNSLSYLKSLQVHRVKIDGSFVRDIVSNPRSEAMVRAVVQLASNLGVDCVAEFVADAAIYKRLLPLGVGYVQGYYIHEPEPLTHLLKTYAVAESQRVRHLSLGL
jgi:diguanylate cyclase (GGDEF)-like protein